MFMFRSAQKENTKKVNIKRENKAYSYKEQIIELELQEVEWTAVSLFQKLCVWVFFLALPPSV